jgi:hypothetical protein
MILVDAPRAVVFITYGGYEFGPRKLNRGALLALGWSILGFNLSESFAAQASISIIYPKTFHGDIRIDLMKRFTQAQLFMKIS